MRPRERRWKANERRVRKERQRLGKGRGKQSPLRATMGNHLGPTRVAKEPRSTIARPDARPCSSMSATAILCLLVGFDRRATYYVVGVRSTGGESNYWEPCSHWGSIDYISGGRVNKPFAGGEKHKDKEVTSDCYKNRDEAAGVISQSEIAVPPRHESTNQRASSSQCGD